jgi:hypothetical protein
MLIGGWGRSLIELFPSWRDEVEGVIETEVIECFGVTNEGLFS